MANDIGSGDSTTCTSDLPATHSSNRWHHKPLTEATEPISSAAQQTSSLSSSQVTRIALNREIARARLLSRGPRCCKCGPTGTCTRCSCARADPPRPCSDCRAGSCQNIAQPLALPAASAVSSDPSVKSGLVNGNLPSMSTVLSADSRHVPTVRHIPKNARNAWASILTVIACATLDCVCYTGLCATLDCATPDYIVSLLLWLIRFCILYHSQSIFVSTHVS